jgi:hypothetical protein
VVCSVAKAHSGDSNNRAIKVDFISVFLSVFVHVLRMQGAGPNVVTTNVKHRPSQDSSPAHQYADTMLQNY